VASSYRRRGVYTDVFWMVRIAVLCFSSCFWSFYRPQDEESALVTPAIPSTTWDSVSAAFALALVALPTVWWTFAYKLYRCKTSNLVHRTTTWLLTSNVIWGLMKAGGISNPDDFTMYDIMVGYNAIVLGLLLMLFSYWYVMEHYVCACYKKRKGEYELEAILVAAIPHPAGERAHRRRVLLGESLSKKATWRSKMRESLKRDAAESPREEDASAAVEQQWRDNMEKMLKEAQAKALDQSLVEADRMAEVDKAEHIKSMLGEQKKLTLEMELAETKALDEGLSDVQRLQWAEKATEAADRLNVLVASPVWDPMQNTTKLDEMLEEVQSHGTATASSKSHRSYMFDFIHGSIHRDEQELFMNEIEMLHYDGSWDDKGLEPVDHRTRPFYKPFFEIFPANNHHRYMWPVNRGLIEEIIRENQYNHYLDSIRNARRILDYCSKMNATPQFISAESILPHLRNVNRCLQMIKRRRVMHHAHAIHPLQMTFEDLMDELLYEYKNAKGNTLVQGKNARRLPLVSAYLHQRMNRRDRVFGLFSPLMKRVILKLLTLRMFIELIVEKQIYLRCPAARIKAVEDESKRAQEEDAFFAGEEWDSFHMVKGASAADLNLDAEEMESEEFMSDKELEDAPRAATPTPPPPIERGKSLGEEWIKSSDEDSEEEPISEPPKIDSEDDDMFVDMEERIKRRAMQMEKEEAWRKQKELERAEAKKRRKEERKREKLRKKEEDARLQAEAEEAEQKRVAEEAARKAAEEAERAKNQAEEEARLEAEKVEKMKAMAEERKAWLKAEAEKKERELQAQEQERIAEEERRKREAEEMERQQKEKEEQARQQRIEEERRRAEEQEEIERQKVVQRERQKKMEEERLRQEENERQAKLQKEEQEREAAMLQEEERKKQAETEAESQRLRKERLARLKQESGEAVTLSESEVEAAQRAALTKGDLLMASVTSISPVSGAAQSERRLSSSLSNTRQVASTSSSPQPLDSVPSASTPQPSASTPQPEEGVKVKKKGKKKRDTSQYESEVAARCAEMDYPALKSYKKRLMKDLNGWKASFIEQHGREPMKKDIEPLAIADTYAEYKVVSQALKDRKKTQAGGDEAEDDENDGN